MFFSFRTPMPSLSDNNDDLGDSASQALAAFEEGRYTSKRSAALAFGVHEGMLQHRKNGRKSRDEIHAKTHKFTDTQEKALCRWIKDRDLDLDRNRARPIEILEVAKEISLAAGRDQLGVTERWVKDFVRRKASITGDLCKGYVSQIFYYPSPEIFIQWYRYLCVEIDDHDIPPDQVFSLSVSGLQMGCIGNVTSSGEEIEISSDPSDWITIIDCLYASGGALDPYIMFRGRHHQMDSLYQDLPPSLVVNSCLKSWSKADILVKWLQEHFVPFLKSKITGKHSLLLVDISRHLLNEEFVSICEERKIRIVSPLKSLPDQMYQLDVTLIGNLKKFYHKYIQKKLSLTERDAQLEFFNDLLEARKTDLTQDLIKRRFKRSGIMPVDVRAASKQFELLYTWSGSRLVTVEDECEGESNN